MRRKSARTRARWRLVRHAEGLGPTVALHPARTNRAAVSAGHRTNWNEGRHGHDVGTTARCARTRRWARARGGWRAHPGAGGVDTLAGKNLREPRRVDVERPRFPCRARHAAFRREPGVLVHGRSPGPLPRVL